MHDTRYTLAIDIGGTFLKYALINGKGRIHNDDITQVAVDSSGDCQGVLSVFTDVIRSSFDTAKHCGIHIQGVGIGTPGPFDYANSTSLMEHKYRSIRGVNLAEELKKRIPQLGGTQMVFGCDAHTFLMGEAWRGAGAGYSKIAGITIGTGLGMGYMVDGAVVHNGRGGPYKRIFRMPYRDATIEDFVSKRGILNQYARLNPFSVKDDLDVKTLAEMACDGQNQTAVEVFRQTGSILGEFLKDILMELNVECLILGGQISKAFDLFGDNLRAELTNVPTLQKVAKAERIDISPLLGAAKLILDLTATSHRIETRLLETDAPRPVDKTKLEPATPFNVTSRPKSPRAIHVVDCQTEEVDGCPPGQPMANSRPLASPAKASSDIANRRDSL